MSTEQSKPINPFEAAIGRMRHDFVVSVGIHDIQAIRNDWPPQRAEAFLRQHGATLANAMLQACSQTIARLMVQPDETDEARKNQKDKGADDAVEE